MLKYSGGQPGLWASRISSTTCWPKNENGIKMIRKAVKKDIKNSHKNGSMRMFTNGLADNHLIGQTRTRTEKIRCKNLTKKYQQGGFIHSGAVPSFSTHEFLTQREGIWTIVSRRYVNAITVMRRHSSREGTVYRKEKNITTLGYS